jgi:hypothetical protein
LTFAIDSEKLRTELGAERELKFEQITPAALTELRPKLKDVRRCRLSHPSGRSYLKLLQDVGFRQLFPSRSGAEFAGRLFDATPAEQRPKDLDGVDRLVRPGAAVAVWQARSIDKNPWITAAK